MQETWNKKIVSLTEWVSQLALLNLTWLFTSLPILTLPASTHTLFFCVANHSFIREIKKIRRNHFFVSFSVRIDLFFNIF